MADTAGDKSSGGKEGVGNGSPAEGPLPLSLGYGYAVITAAAAVAATFDLDQVSLELSDLLASLILDVPKEIDTKYYDSTDPKIAFDANQRNFSISKAGNSLSSAQSIATSTFQQALNVWKLAVDQYDLEMENADVTLRSNAATAVETFIQKCNSSDSKNRIPNLYYMLDNTVAVDIQTSQATAAASLATLAAAAGALLVANATYVGAVTAAQTTYLIDHSAAD